MPHSSPWGTHSTNAITAPVQVHETLSCAPLVPQRAAGGRFEYVSLGAVPDVFLEQAVRISFCPITSVC
ncbi:hypothetical protein EI94DRAFT_1731215 [Lactarius quietus]|nr:hypothetical protein EI94DRAFT_1740075 [Lactarius quietus]KAF8267109.1 hypothetical protein EI94DRAFT_1731215 [Lactarius quietus]